MRPKTIVNSTFWKKTLNSTLSKEQKETWENFVTEQLEHKREKMADAAIASFNIEFGLTLEQQEAFAELVRPKLLGIKLKTIETIGRKYERHMYSYYASKASKSEIEKIFTKAQMQQWKITVSTAKYHRSWFEE